ncbi:MAG: hypothetical protein ACOY4D_05425 [Pseudomonadota bacterium]
MSITEFDYDSFYGLRVMRSAGGKKRYRYFSFLVDSKGGRKRRATPREIGEIRQAAEDYDRMLAKWQRKRREKLRRQAIPTARNTTTPVRGIRFGMIIQIKRGKRYAWPGFILGSKDAAGKTITRQYPIRAYGVDGAWKCAVETLVKVKRWPANTVPVLLARKPDQAHLQSVLGQNWEVQ